MFLTKVIDIFLIPSQKSYYITKTSLFQYTANFTTKNGNFQIKKSDVSYFCLKHRLLDLVRTTSTSKNKNNNVYPHKPHFYYIKMGFEGLNFI